MRARTLSLGLAFFFLPFASRAIAQVCATGTEPGCACQFADQVSRTPIGAAVVSSDYPQAFTRAADNTYLLLPKNLKALSWWGTFRVAAGYCGSVVTPAFQITLYEDDGSGIPGFALTTFFADVNNGLTRKTTGKSFTYLGTTVAEERYNYHLPAPMLLGGLQNYWVEIKETHNRGGPCFWVWETTGVGDQNMLLDIGQSGYDPADVRALDLAWCLEFEDLPAACIFRNGTGVNPPDYTCLTPPILGTNWTVDLAVTPSTVSTYIGLGLAPDAGLPLFGGEFLLALSPPPVFAPGLGRTVIPLPNVSAFLGITLYTQGMRVDQLGQITLLNAQDARLGF